MVCSSFLNLYKASDNLEVFQEGRDLARHLGCKLIETSAKCRYNVDEAFTSIVREISKCKVRFQLECDIHGNYFPSDKLYSSRKKLDLWRLQVLVPGIV
jgi:Fe2+ transport system protein B